jgi:hypothetical protein
MANELRTLIYRITTEPESLAEFKKDPEGFMAGAGLTKEERQMLAHGDPEAIRKALLPKPGEPVHPDNVTVVVYTATYVKTVKA